MDFNNGITIVYGKVLCPAATYNNCGSVAVTFPITFTRYFSTGLAHYASGSGWGHCTDAFKNSGKSGFTIVQYQPWNFTKDALHVWYINIGY